MPEKRKDSKGRVLKDGENQRANGTYDYRYTDIHKKRRCIYAKSLTELRKKEEEQEAGRNLYMRIMPCRSFIVM